MLLRRATAILVFTAAAALAWAGTPGTFRGTVHEGANIKPGWIYVEAFNGNLRLVDVRRANIHYEDPVEDEGTPSLPDDRPRPRLTTGTEVRVTAEPDKRGHWHASEVEVIRETSRR